MGRLNETIKRRGYRVNLLDIDSYIQKIEEVQNCITIAYDDDIVDNKLLCCILISSEIDDESLFRKMKQFLVDYQVPDKVVYVKSFPLNSSGKICRMTLKEMYKDAI